MSEDYQAPSGAGLSPAAAAIAGAYDNAPEKETGNHRYYWLAAALRAAADQCAEGATHWALYAIAAELEQLND